MQQMVDHPFMMSALIGIRIGAAVLILTMAARLIKASASSLLTGLIACATFMLYVLGISPIWAIVGAGMLGALHLIVLKRELR